MKFFIVLRLEKVELAIRASSIIIQKRSGRRIKDEVPLGQESAPIYEGGSRYGTNLFIEELDKLIQTYEESIEGDSEIRVLSTFEYGREVQHALVVVPNNDIRFQSHYLVAKWDSDGNYIWLEQPCVKHNNHGYTWHPFSTVKWNNFASPPKERKWAHLAFAFYLDPLPNETMPVPGVGNDANWMGCHWQDIQLITQYDP
ncbi:hypothetical protein CHS0354_016437 [Potamilus streckersoni]|uniref:Uncharacterized protein n=1 Tax=Potamilus streckersoni TaxID=2493646 RepID=A0AAE0WEQ6_9BIVA|nr:hypothetical protein CHS0354_016437 [Potamilus streckersoni]